MCVYVCLSSCIVQVCVGRFYRICWLESKSRSGVTVEVEVVGMGVEVDVEAEVEAFYRLV